MAFTLMAVSCRTFSLLGHILINHVFGVITVIAHGDGIGGDEDGCDGVRYVAKSGDYCAAKTTPPIKTIALIMLQHPLRPAKPVQRKRIDHRAPFTQRKRQPWSIETALSELKRPKSDQFFETLCAKLNNKQVQVLYNVNLEIIFINTN